jgi:hypothetical protein
MPYPKSQIQIRWVQKKSVNVGKLHWHVFRLPDPHRRKQPVESVRRTFTREFSRAYFCAIKANREYSTSVSSHQIGDKVSRLAIPYLDAKVVAAADYEIGIQRNVAY